MDLPHFKQLLLAKEQELLADLAGTKNQVRDSATPEVEDEMDVAVRTEEKEGLLDQGSRDYDTLEQVRDALRRIDAGTYGLCLVCGRPIEPKRLEAIPWAAYDVQHQAEVDSDGGKPAGGATL